MPKPFYLARPFLHRLKEKKNSTTAPADKEENNKPFLVLLWSEHRNPQMVKQKLFNAQKQTPKAYSHLKQDCLYLPAEMIHKGIFFFFFITRKGCLFSCGHF